ncbi:SDR family NAD(P)-dependent oxidoreductase [Chitinophagaceae bacterium MMS25-I14]
MENKNKVWFITGASKGLGLTLVKKLLQQGHWVAATSRNREALAAAADDNSNNFLPLSVDLTSETSVERAVKMAHETFGRIDVVVNNAGYGTGGALEELTPAEVKECFDVNVFATITVIQKVMPYLRTQRSGHIINIASIAGFAPGMGWSIYAAAKHAVMGLTDVLATDIKELGIHATVVAPGAFRTEFLSQQSLVLSDRRIEDYKAVHANHERFLAMDGNQAGDPEAAADVFIALAEDPEPPVQLFLGSDAYNRAKAKLQQTEASLEKYKSISVSTDF